MIDLLRLESGNEELLLNVISEFGADSQIDKAAEEMAELIQALLKNRKAGREHPATLDNVYEEMADVIITFSQLRLIYNNESKLNDKVHEKLDGLRALIEPKGSITGDMEKLLEEVFERGMEHDIIGKDEMKSEIDKIKKKHGWL